MKDYDEALMRSIKRDSDILAGIELNPPLYYLLRLIEKQDLEIKSLKDRLDKIEKQDAECKNVISDWSKAWDGET
jgi:hypothetical protein